MNEAVRQIIICSVAQDLCGHNLAKILDALEARKTVEITLTHPQIKVSGIIEEPPATESRITAQLKAEIQGIFETKARLFNFTFAWINSSTQCVITITPPPPAQQVTRRRR